MSNAAQQYAVVVIGGGPAGLAAALSARQHCQGRVLLLERAESLGGVLNQCIHSGFGLHYFKEELTGPEYAERFIHMLEGSGVEVLCGATALSIDSHRRRVWAVHPQRGYWRLDAGAIVLAMGCRERTRGAIGIPGTRPAGVFTAGAAQLYMNLEGYHIGRKAVILGSGDIGLIMARRLCLEGAEVEGVYELMPHSSGLTRNIVQCLHDFSIPLHLSHTVTDIQGDRRVEAVVVQQVDAARLPLPGTEREIPCDTLLLSVGLIPENELSRAAGLRIDPRTGGPEVFENMECSLPGIFACGNTAHVHDLVDFVTAESQRAGKAAALFRQETTQEPSFITLNPGEGLGYLLPHKIRLQADDAYFSLYFRVKSVLRNAEVCIVSGDETIFSIHKPHMAPGEMQRLNLPRNILEKTHDNSLIIQIKRGDAI